VGSVEGLSMTNGDLLMFIVVFMCVVYLWKLCSQITKLEQSRIDDSIRIAQLTMLCEGEQRRANVLQAAIEFTLKHDLAGQLWLDGWFHGEPEMMKELDAYMKAKGQADASRPIA
jgi:hypothetical protein